jgi:hypothetical protein
MKTIKPFDLFVDELFEKKRLKKSKTTMEHIRKIVEKKKKEKEKENDDEVEPAARTNKYKEMREEIKKEEEKELKENLNEAKKKDSFTYKDMENCWYAARRKRIDTGISMHDSFENWIKKY